MSPFPKIRSLKYLLLVLPLLLTACQLSSIGSPLTFFSDKDPGLRLAAGQTSNVHFFTSETNVDTGVTLQAGNRYALDIVVLSHWIDSDITRNENGEPLDQRGFSNSLMPLEFLGSLRRSRQHRWFELMLYQPNCGRDSLRGVTDLETDEASGSYYFVATCDGKLSLFVNDSFGFYSNNAGYANIALSRVN